MDRTIALFGEAERGQYRRGEYCSSLVQLLDQFGQPPAESTALHFAVQSLIYEWDIIFFRVREEGFSVQDYLKGLQSLRQSRGSFRLAAIALPGVGDRQIIDISMEICREQKSILVTSEADFYDYASSLSCPKDY